MPIYYLASTMATILTSMRLYKGAQVHVQHYNFFNQAVGRRGLFSSKPCNGSYQNCFLE